MSASPVRAGAAFPVVFRGTAEALLTVRRVDPVAAADVRARPFDVGRSDPARRDAEPFPPGAPAPP